MNGCIYLITCLENGKRYVGQSRYPDPMDRFGEHCYSAEGRKSKDMLHQAIRKYGRDRFSVVTLCVAPHEALDNMEAYYAEQFETYKWDSPGGYNMVWCGKGNRRGISHTPETKQLQSELAKERGHRVGPKISVALTGRKMSEEQRENHRVAMSSEEVRKKIGDKSRGRKTSDETKAKISEASKSFWTDERRAEQAEKMKNREVKEETRKKLSEAHTGKEVSAETREKLRQANLGKKQSEETRQKQSLQRIGKPTGPFSEEARKNMSLAKKGKPASEALRAALKETASQKFDALFHKHLPEWIADPREKKQWWYDMSRKKRDGRLLEKYVVILESTPGWTWSSR